MVSSTLQAGLTQTYNKAVALLEAGGDYVVNNPVKAREGKVRNLRMAQSNLISIIPINVNTTEYLLNVMSNEPNLGNAGIINLENRLTLQDVMFTAALGFFLTPLSLGGYTPSHFQFNTNPDPYYGGLFGIGDLSALIGIWTSGNLEVKVGGEVVTPKHWLMPHMSIPQTQDIYAGTAMNPFWTQQNGSDDGYVITDPMWILNGGNLNQYTISYGPDWGQVLGGLNAGNTVQFGIALVWKGWLCQNASSIMNNMTKK